MDKPLNGGYDGGSGTEGGGDLNLPPPEHYHTIYWYQYHYGPVPVDGEESGAKGVQVVVGTGQGGCGGDADGGLGGATDGGGGGDGWEIDRHRLNRRRIIYQR